MVTWLKFFSLLGIEILVDFKFRLQLHKPDRDDYLI